LYYRVGPERIPQMSDLCELRRMLLKLTSEKPQKAKFAEYLFHALR
jgi:hypothetical protein